MARQTFQSNPKVNQIFNDLESYREFCVDYGYKFDESTLYDMRSYIFRQYNKFTTGKIAKNNWDEDLRRLYA